MPRRRPPQPPLARPSLAALVVVTATAMGASPPARAAALRSPGAALAVAAAAGGAVVVTGRGVDVYDRAGQLVRTLAGPPGATRRRPRPAADGPAAATLFPMEDVPSSYGEDGAEALDAGGASSGDDADAGDGIAAADRREWASGGNDDGLAWNAAVAAGGRAAFVGGGAGLVKIDLSDGTSARVLAPVGAGVRAVATGPDGGVVVAAGGGWLLRSSDGGQSFATVAALGGAPRALAVTSGGDALVIDASGLRRAGTARATLDPIVVEGLVDPADVVSCGAVVLSFDRSSRALFALVAGRAPPASPGRTTGQTTDHTTGRTIGERIGEVPAGTRRLACAPDGGLLVAWGAEVWTSPDRGASWSPRLDVPPAPVAGLAVAAAAGRAAVWVATAAGLWTLPSASAAPARVIQMPSSLSAGPHAAGGLRARGAMGGVGWSWWHSLLPRVDLALSWARRGLRHEVRGLALATFRIDGPWLGTAPAHPITLARARALGAAVAARTALSMAALGTAADPVDPDGEREERDALTRVLEDVP